MSSNQSIAFEKLKKRYQNICSKFDSLPINSITKKLDESATTQTSDPFLSIIISSLTLSPNQIASIAQLWSKERLGLESWRLWNCNLNLNATTLLVDFLLSLKNLNVVEFVRLSYAKGDIRQIPRFCQFVQNITQLSLDHTHLDDSAYHVFDALKANRGLKLKRFSARFCTIKPSACYSISSYLKTADSLITLELAGNKIGIAGLSMMLPSLEHNQTVKTIGLAFNEIEDEIVNGKDVFRALCTTVGAHRSITLLNLSGNYFSEHGYKAVIAGLEVRKQLLSAGASPGLSIKVPERIRSDIYEQIHSLNSSLKSK